MRPYESTPLLTGGGTDCRPCVTIASNRRPAPVSWAFETTPESGHFAFLVRVVAEPNRDSPEVVTAYRTSHVGKYRQVDDAD